MRAANARGCCGSKNASRSRRARDGSPCTRWPGPARCTMLRLDLGINGRALRLLCLGAHSDDLEIGCGGTLLEWLRAYSSVEVTWVVMSAPGRRADEAQRSAHALLAGAR